MSDAFIYDHVRTPRGKGKKDGSLHQAAPVWLLRTLPNNVLGHIGIKYGLKGSNACITSHSCSGSLAVIEGMEAGGHIGPVTTSVPEAAKAGTARPLAAASRRAKPAAIRAMAGFP